MQLNQTYVPDEVTVQVNKHVGQLCHNQALFHNCPVSYVPWGTLTQRELDSVEQLQQDKEQTVPPSMHPSSYPSSSLTTRREKNRERERKRQTRLKGAFNALRRVIPDQFSEREPGDTLSRIQTLRLAKKYIAVLHELLQTS